MLSSCPVDANSSFVFQLVLLGQSKKKMTWLWLLLSFSLVGFFLAGCACCPPACMKLQDLFNRANSTNLGADWTEVAGNWEILTNALRIPATANAIATCTTTTPTANATVNVKIKLGTINDLARVILNYADSNNYLFAELSRLTSTGHLKIGKRVAAVETILEERDAPGIDFNTFVSVKFCVDTANTLLSALILGTSQSNSHGVSVQSGFTAGAGTTAGLGTGATAAGNIDFDDFTLDEGDTRCTACLAACYRCTAKYTPESISLDISGVVNGTCVACAGLNGVFVCDAVVSNAEVDLFTDGRRQCAFLRSAAFGCGILKLQVVAAGTATNSWYMRYGPTLNGISIEWNKDYDPPCTLTVCAFDCDRTADTIPWLGDRSPECVGSGSTLLLTTTP